jgi:HD-GYP domain-containing protein (c-di-GMP phosphodiesterase class II)
MFDALTEADRPYKHSLSAEAAFDILSEEANAGRIDGELFANPDGEQGSGIVDSAAF